MRAGALHSSASLLAGDSLVVYGQQPPSRGKRQEQGGWRAPESGAGGAGWTAGSQEVSTARASILESQATPTSPSSTCVLRTKPQADPHLDLDPSPLHWPLPRPTWTPSGLAHRCWISDYPTEGPWTQGTEFGSPYGRGQHGPLGTVGATNVGPLISHQEQSHLLTKHPQSQLTTLGSCSFSKTGIRAVVRTYTPGEAQSIHEGAWGHLVPRDPSSQVAAGWW